MDNLKKLEVEAYLQKLRGRFRHPHWDGPYLSEPQVTATLQAASHVPVVPRWELWVSQSAPNSRNPKVTSGGVRAALSFDSVEDLLASPVELVAYNLTVAIAGQAAHEALEWVRLDGELVVDPHGELSDLKLAISDVARYLEQAGS